MIITALNTFTGVLDLSALERLQESNPFEKYPFRLSIRPGQSLPVDDSFYNLTSIQNALNLGYIQITITANPFQNAYIQSFLDAHPLSAAQTFKSTVGPPDANWDSNDTAGVGKEFGIGFFVQDQSNNALYRCLNATPTAAVWYLVIQEVP